MSRSRGFTLIELLVVISVVALLISILLPALASMRMVARTAQCKSNLRQVGIAVFARAADTDDYVLQGDYHSLSRWWDAQSAYPSNYMAYFGGGKRYFHEYGLNCPDIPEEILVDVKWPGNHQPTTYTFNQFWWTASDKSWIGTSANKQDIIDKAQPVRLNTAVAASRALIMFGSSYTDPGHWTLAWDRKVPRHGAQVVSFAAPPAGVRTNMLFADGHVALAEYTLGGLYEVTLDDGGGLKLYKEMLTKVRP